MGGEWYTTPDASGEVTVEWRDDAWHLADTGENGDVKCMLPDEEWPSPTESPHQIDVRVRKFMRAVERGPSYLFFDRTNHADTTGDTATDSSGETPSTNQNTTTKRPQPNESRSTDRTMLDKIAREKIGDQAFTLSEEDTESVVGEAKKRARKQGRDPAIDPKLNPDDEE